MTTLAQTRHPTVIQRVYLPCEQAKLTAVLAEKWELSQSELLSRIVRAGIEAVKDRPKLELPLRFELQKCPAR